MGTARAPVSLSGRCPACSARVLNPKTRSGTLLSLAPFGEILQESVSSAISPDCTKSVASEPQSDFLLTFYKSGCSLLVEDLQESDGGIQKRSLTGDSGPARPKG